MYPSRSYIWFLGPQLRKFHTSFFLRSTKGKSHYDSLGISSKATQADVKSAYYKLSKVYHPDRNKDSDDAAQKFRDITEAYEVLGNVKSRKLYDRGLYFEGVTSGVVRDDPPLNKFYKSRDTQSRPPSEYGRTTVYDFDEWSKAHYGATFQNTLRFKAREKMKMKREKELAEHVKTEKLVLMTVLFAIMAAYVFYEDNDDPNRVVIFGEHIIDKSKTDK
ncbi:dnaJ homolog subfamily C member 30, mitochondrial [Tribolium castaneum]|uniref:DnaJ homolog subfamily C member 30-like Protein n=1 Tax=Tribolium castaneum TaxID=7070 RepID=D2A3L8_TRICA|nr:PREDICTED: dnaJ homolog subfamily C member 30 [Tribolium castaneum]EFA05522.1 DnaJ homolog subfamily C member 30-like Protein [Tribolium castaneum]|eukprot:XP_001811514.1 PREDICTED: dnaJ homolog subfamily C member 30 [Tribolium castaneum]